MFLHVTEQRVQETTSVRFVSRRVQLKTIHKPLKTRSYDFFFYINYTKKLKRNFLERDEERVCYNYTVATMYVFVFHTKIKEKISFQRYYFPYTVWRRDVQHRINIIRTKSYYTVVGFTRTSVIIEIYSKTNIQYARCVFKNVHTSLDWLYFQLPAIYVLIVNNIVEKKHDIFLNQKTNISLHPD